MPKIRPIRRALVSVSDKDGVVDFCRQLSQLNVEILSTGGTAKLLAEANIAVTQVSDYTQFPELMEGRVKTLHPRIHGGILARRDQDEAQMVEHNILPIDLVVVNLYPFEATIAQPDCSYQQAVENIDIGGPCMLRAAAKNHQDVTVIVDSKDYSAVLQQLEALGGTDFQSRQQLALKAFRHTAYYDSIIAGYLDQGQSFTEQLTLPLSKISTLRYGENPHQQAAFYSEPNAGESSLAKAKQAQGKQLSFNNIADSDAAWECVCSFPEPTCTIVKHANPCGVATAENILTAYEKAYQTDPTSAFGGIIAFNRTLDKDTAQTIIARQFVEVIICPEVTDEAKTVLAQKANIRLLTCALPEGNKATLNYKRVSGGFLVQEKDQHLITEADLKVVSRRQPDASQLQDLLFAWQVAKQVKSNAIVYAKNRQTIGIGAGQMSRVYSAKIAGIKAQDENLAVPGSVMASDAFFPFRDGIDAAGQAGISAIIQPGGSMRDEEVIAAANEHNMAMVFTGIRHFNH